MFPAFFFKYIFKDDFRKQIVQLILVLKRDRDIAKHRNKQRTHTNPIIAIFIIQ